MQKVHALFTTLALALIVSAAPRLDAQRLAYPPTRKVDQVDTYFGTTVEDPYRWLEDENAPETTRWVDAQNTLTFDWLGRVPYPYGPKARVTKFSGYPPFTTPPRKGEYYNLSK